jgi:MOSC domain-containing protein YiiM
MDVRRSLLAWKKLCCNIYKKATFGFNLATAGFCQRAQIGETVIETSNTYCEDGL